MGFLRQNFREGTYTEFADSGTTTDGLIIRKDLTGQTLALKPDGSPAFGTDPFVMLRSEAGSNSVTTVASEAAGGSTGDGGNGGGSEEPEEPNGED
jgi:hypothetical protein